MILGPFRTLHSNSEGPRGIQISYRPKMQMAKGIRTPGGNTELTGRVSHTLLLATCCVLVANPCLGWQQQPATPHPNAPPVQAQDAERPEEVAPGDWAAQLLDGILSAPNAEASDWMFRAAFAAGPSIIPQLTEALKDDRTAEYAAQALAFIGGEQAMQALWKLKEDKRDLNLRRFYYGALAEYDNDRANQTLFQVIDKSDSEPDRTVTEAAILALTVRTEPKLTDLIRQMEKKVNDVVIRDDLENARDVIQIRSKYLATPEGKKAGGSLDAAVRTYFIPALKPPAPPPSDAQAHHPPSKPDVSVDIQNLTLSPDRQRALAAVTLEDPSALAKYDLILQKRSGNWEVVSAWLGGEIEKQPPTPPSDSTDDQ